MNWPCARSHSFANSGEPLIHKHAAALAEEEFSFFFDSDVPMLILPHFHLMRLLERFGEPAGMFFNHLVVDFDHRRSKELIEAELKEIFLHLTKFQAQFHRQPPGLRTTLFTSAL